MARIPESERAILERQIALLEQKISQEKYSLEHGGVPPGNPVGFRYIPGETREGRLARWKEALGTLETAIEGSADH